MQNALPTEQAAVAGVIDPDAASTGTYTTGWVSMADFEQIMAAVMAGTLGASATVDAKIEEATDGSGSSSQDLSGKSITQLTQAGTDDSDKQALINVRAEELSDGYSHVRLSITVGTASSDVAGMVLGFNPRYAPASDQDASTVSEIV